MHTRLLRSLPGRAVRRAGRALPTLPSQRACSSISHAADAAAPGVQQTQHGWLLRRRDGAQPLVAVLDGTNLTVSAKLSKSAPTAPAAAIAQWLHFLSLYMRPDLLYVAWDNKLGGGRYADARTEVHQWYLQGRKRKAGSSVAAAAAFRTQQQLTTGEGGAGRGPPSCDGQTQQQLLHQPGGLIRCLCCSHRAGPLPPFPSAVRSSQLPSGSGQAAAAAAAAPAPGSASPLPQPVAAAVQAAGAVSVVAHAGYEADDAMASLAAWVGATGRRPLACIRLSPPSMCLLLGIGST